MLSMKAKYALRALVELAKSDDEVMQAKTISANAGNIPIKFLEAILSDLKNRGIVSSKRGAMGGYCLSKPAEVIKVGDIIRITDGPLAPIRCVSITAYRRCDDCVDEKTCAIRHIMHDVRIAISNVLDTKTIKDMVDFGESEIF